MKTAFILRTALATLVSITGAAQAANPDCEKPKTPFLAALCEDAELWALSETFEAQRAATKDIEDRLSLPVREYANHDDWLSP
jgi:uncharacterized protein